MSMPKLNAPAEIHWRRSNMNTRDPILMKSVEVLKDCRSSNAAAEMNCPMPRSVEKVPIRNEKRCNKVKGLQFLVDQENCSLIYKVNIRILRESMKISCI